MVLPPPPPHPPDEPQVVLPVTVPPPGLEPVPFPEEDEGQLLHPLRTTKPTSASRNNSRIRLFVLITSSRGFVRSRFSQPYQHQSEKSRSRAQNTLPCRSTWERPFRKGNVTSERGTTLRTYLLSEFANGGHLFSGHFFRLFPQRIPAVHSFCTSECEFSLAGVF